MEECMTEECIVEPVKNRDHDKCVGTEPMYLNYQDSINSLNKPGEPQVMILGAHRINGIISRGSDISFKNKEIELIKHMFDFILKEDTTDSRASPTANNNHDKVVRLVLDRGEYSAEQITQLIKYANNTGNTRVVKIL